MHVRFYHYRKPAGSLEPAPFEVSFIEDMSAGLDAHGDTYDVVFAGDWQDYDLADVAAFVGVRGTTRDIVDAYRAAGKRTIIMDKGAIRHHNISEYRRIYLDGGTALAYLMRVKRPSDRWERLGIEIKQERDDPPAPGAPIVYANNSQKVHDYWRLGDARACAEETVQNLMKIAPSRKIIFRPKPRVLDFSEIPGAELSLKPDSIEDALLGAHCLVTHHSHCTVNAIIAGVPVVTLGPNPASGVAGKYIEQALRPPILHHKRRKMFLQNLAYAQWLPEEMRSGEMWEFIKGEMAATLPSIDEPLGPNTRKEENESIRDDSGEVGVERCSE